MVNNFDQNDELYTRNLKNIDNEKLKEALTSTNFKQVLHFTAITQTSPQVFYLEKYATLTRIIEKIQKTYSKPQLTKIFPTTTKIKYTKCFVKQNITSSI